MDITEQLTHESRIALAAAAEITRLRAEVEALTAQLQSGESMMKALLKPIWRNQEKAVEAKALVILDEFNMVHMKDEFAGALSGGQRKLLEMARSMMTDPKVIMLDEPASGLNSIEQADLKRLILRLRGEGTSILLIEHILPLLFGVSERVMVMDFGRKLTEGPPSEIAHDPRVIEAYLGGKAMEGLHAS